MEKKFRAEKDKFYSFIEQLILDKPTLRRKLTVHWTYSDALSKQAKRILKEREGSA